MLYWARLYTEVYVNHPLVLSHIGDSFSNDGEYILYEYPPVHLHFIFHLKPRSDTPESHLQSYNSVVIKLTTQVVVSRASKSRLKSSLER